MNTKYRITVLPTKSKKFPFTSKVKFQCEEQAHFSIFNSATKAGARKISKEFAESHARYLKLKSKLK